MLSQQPQQTRNHLHQHYAPPQQQQQQPLVAPPPVFNGVDPFYPGLRQIHCDPPIFKVENFLTPEECDHLINVASDSFSPAPVVGAGAGVVSQTRTSSTCYLAREDLPFLCRKVHKLTGKPICHMELPQVGRYLNTQQYLPHYDAFNVNESDGARFAANGGQRTVTVLIYLNDVSSGGHTAFPQLVSQRNSQEQLQVQPSRGSALVFFPATVDGHLDPRTLHAALPAVDTKFVSQIWIRQGNFDGQCSKRLEASQLLAGHPPLTPQETQGSPPTTIADTVQKQQQQQHQMQQMQQQQQPPYGQI